MADGAMTGDTVRLGKKLFQVKGKVLYFPSTAVIPYWCDTELVVIAIDDGEARAKYEAWYTDQDRNGSQGAQAYSAEEIQVIS